MDHDHGCRSIEEQSESQMRPTGKMRKHKGHSCRHFTTLVASEKQRQHCAAKE
jgi:hypothetical protein